MKNTIRLILVLALLLGCKNEREQVRHPIVETSKSEMPTVEIAPSKAEKLIEKAIEAHGGELYDSADYSFVFRGNTYTFKNDTSGYKYTLDGKDKKGNPYYDELKNGTFTRTIHGKVVSLSVKDVDKYSSALNSVVYFATLPHKLSDAAVNKRYIEENTIKGKQYDVVEVTFGEKGGGKDHDDEFHYWINKETNKIDYLAYNYRVNKGGVRFRSTYNRRVVDGITFQDYVNWKATMGTRLKDLPALFEQGKLKELSRIETENVINLNK